jgi:hypothetical protein
MKRTLPFVFGILFIVMPIVSSADVIYLKNGEKIEAPDVWEENGWVKYKVSGIEVSFPKDEVERIEKKEFKSDKTPSSLAECWVSRETPYSSKKELMAIYVDLAFEQRKWQKAGRMVNQGIIKQTPTHQKDWYPCKVLARDGKLVNVDLSGRGNVWVYQTYVFCGGKRLEHRLDQK